MWDMFDAVSSDFDTEETELEFMHLGLQALCKTTLKLAETSGRLNALNSIDAVVANKSDTFGFGIDCLRRYWVSAGVYF